MTPLSASLVHICKYIAYIKGSGKRRRQKKKKPNNCMHHENTVIILKIKLLYVHVLKDLGKNFFLKKDQ